MLKLKKAQTICHAEMSTNHKLIQIRRIVESHENNMNGMTMAISFSRSLSLFFLFALLFTSFFFPSSRLEWNWISVNRFVAEVIIDFIFIFHSFIPLLWPKASNKHSTQCWFWQSHFTKLVIHNRWCSYWIRDKFLLSSALHQTQRCSIHTTTEKLNSNWLF